MRRKVLFVVNALTEFGQHDLVRKHLSDAEVTIGESVPERTEEHDLIVLWSYRRIVAGISEKRNVILFHSSDLPEGKGWAPIYGAIIENAPYYTISGIRAVEPVDSGDIVVQARFRMMPSYTAKILRQWDEEVCILLVKMLLDRLGEGGLRGRRQAGKGSFRPRRRSDDNEISLEQRLEDLVPRLRACEPQHPAFFFYHGVKYVLSLEPVPRPPFPDDLQIVFYDS